MDLDLVTTLVPLIIGTALVPIPLIITALLLRSPGGRRVTVAWVAGLMTVRLAQGVLFGLLFGGLSGAGGDSGPVISGGLIVLAIVFLVTGARKALDAPDDDAPPPRWVAMLDGIRPARAFLLGMVVLALGVKHWVFTLGAIAAISGAEMGQGASAATFLVFVVLAHGLQLAMLAVAFLAPARAQAMLGELSGILQRHSRPLLVGVSVVFGIWFLVKGLAGLGVL